MPSELAELRDRSPGSVYRWALRAGWTPEQAGNLIAWFAGIRIVDGEDVPTSSWSLRSIQHLLFVRWLAETGRIGSSVDGGPTPSWYLAGLRSRVSSPSPPG